MFNLNDTMRYFLCPGRTDMRKGISSLCGVVHEKMNSEVKKILFPKVCLEKDK